MRGREQLDVEVSDLEEAVGHAVGD